MAFRSPLVFIILTMNLLSAININALDLKENMHIEEIQYANGNKVISVVEKKSSHTYTPTQNTIVFQEKPMILQSQFGTLYLYDLSKKNAYFNALFYDNLDIEGDLSDVTVGIADKYYYEKEDHIKLFSRKHYQIKNLLHKVDITQLKYIVITSQKPIKSPLLKIVFSRSSHQTSFGTKALSAWAWNPENIHKQNVASLTLNHLYIQMKESFDKALHILEDKNTTVFGLNGSPEDIFHYTHLLKDIQHLSLLKQQFPFITGYQIDVEPYVLKDFKHKKDTFLKQYLKMVQRLKEETQKHALKFSIVIPFWFDNLYIDNKNLGFMLTDIADEITLMSYRSDLNKAVNLSKTLLRYASLTHKNVRIGVELMKIEDEKHTLYKIVDIHSLCLSQNTIKQNCYGIQKLRDYTVKGSDISFYAQTQKLQNIRNHLVPYPSFQGFVFHHFDLLETLPVLDN